MHKRNHIISEEKIIINIMSDKEKQYTIFETKSLFQLLARMTILQT